MRTILITSTKRLAGKSTVGLGLCMWARKKGEKVGYFKPLGDRVVRKDERMYDHDAHLFKEVLGLSESEEKMSIAHDYKGLLRDTSEHPKDYVGELRKRFEELSGGKDLMVVEGAHSLACGAYLGLSAPEIVKHVGGMVLVVATGSSEEVVDRVAMAKAYLNHVGAPMLGVVVNKATEQQISRENTMLVKLFGDIGVEFFGFLPERKSLSRITPRDIVEVLEAEILAGDKGLDTLLERVVVGAMGFEAAMKRLRTIPGNAIITGGDRTDLQLGALETSSRCLILTGGIFPAPTVLREAEQRGVPVLLVPYDTFSAAERIEKITPRIRPEETSKIEEIERLVLEFVELDRLWGVSS
ncbi:MAG: hypothetical protein DRO11_02415 [Methanobacteriota archaeon]|nr:MAG: hypothetical protein DRO11_02415 [Euryarchaeota archaeon]